MNVGGEIGAEELGEIAPLQDGCARLVLVDGRYSSDLSSVPSGTDGVRVSSLADAIEAGNDAVAEHMAQYADIEEDGFIALNTAFISDGAFIEIDDGVSIEDPLHLVFVTTDGAQTVSHPRVLVGGGAWEQFDHCRKLHRRAGQSLPDEFCCRGRS